MIAEKRMLKLLGLNEKHVVSLASATGSDDMCFDPGMKKKYRLTGAPCLMLNSSAHKARLFVYTSPRAIELLDLLFVVLNPETRTIVAWGFADDLGRLADLERMPEFSVDRTKPSLPDHVILSPGFGVKIAELVGPLPADIGLPMPAVLEVDHVIIQSLDETLMRETSSLHVMDRAA